MMAEPSKAAGSRASELARIAALASLLPFLVLAGGMVFAGGHSVWSSAALDGFKTWSAIVLSFFGGIRWGLAMRGEATGSAPFLPSLLPTCFGWVALFMPDAFGIGVLLLAHCAQGAWDSLSAQRGAAPAWFGNLRMVWTLLVAAAHIAMFIAIY